MSNESTTVSAQAIRSEVMHLHEDVRSALRHAAHLAARAHGGDRSCLPELAAALKHLAAAVRRQHAEESRLLDPFLAEIDAWGPERVARLRRERSCETELIETASVRTGPDPLIRAACAIIRPLARLLRQEEREALPPEVLRDDVIAIAQEDG